MAQQQQHSTHDHRGRERGDRPRHLPKKTVGYTPRCVVFLSCSPSGLTSPMPFTSSVSPAEGMMLERLLLALLLLLDAAPVVACLLLLSCCAALHAGPCATSRARQHMQHNRSPRCDRTMLLLCKGENRDAGGTNSDENCQFHQFVQADRQRQSVLCSTDWCVNNAREWGSGRTGCDDGRGSGSWGSQTSTRSCQVVL